MIAICLGSARSVWEDLEGALGVVGDREHIIIACNHAGVAYPGHLDVYATLHRELLEDWREHRAAQGRNTDFRAFVHKRMPGVNAEVLPHGWYGSSGLYMAQVALGPVGASGAILCGVPMDEGAGHITGPDTWPFTERYRPGFLQAKADGANIRSMSGWTAEQMGRPDADWIASMNLGPSRPRVEKREPEMRIKMTRTRNWTPPEERRQTTKYLADHEYTVKRAWGEAMVADGDAVELEAPPRDPLDHDGDGRKGGAKKSRDA